MMGKVDDFTGTVVLVQGSSASGKSRLVSGVNRIVGETGLDLAADFAKRFTTRTPRHAETFSGENDYLNREEFEARVRSGLIDIHWQRPTGALRENLYGFSLAPHLGSNRRVILSANNYLRWEENALLVRLRRANRLVVVRVVAPDATRERRLALRRPPLSPEELAYRMRDVPPGQLPAADYVIPNAEEQQAFAEWEFCKLLSLLKLGIAARQAA